jgi:hypothetical protein
MTSVQGETDECSTLGQVAAKFAHQRNDLNWETLTQRRKIASICAFFNAYTGERAWKDISDRLQKPRYLSRVDHDGKIGTTTQMKDVGKYSFINKTTQQLQML